MTEEVELWGGDSEGRARRSSSRSKAFSDELEGALGLSALELREEDLVVLGER